MTFISYVFNQNSSRYFRIKTCGWANGQPKPVRSFMQITQNKENALEIGAPIMSCTQLEDVFIKPDVIDS